MRASRTLGSSAIGFTIGEERAQLERRPESTVGQPRRDPILAAIDDPAGDDVPRRSTFSLRAGDAALPLPRHELPASTGARSQVVPAGKEAAAIDHDNVAARIVGAGLERTSNTHRERLIEHGFRFGKQIPLELRDGVSHHVKKKITFLQDQGLKIIFPTLNAGGRQLETADCAAQDRRRGLPANRWTSASSDFDSRSGVYHFNRVSC